MSVHATALVDPSVELGQNVEIGPFCVIGPNVQIGDNCKLAPHVVVKGPTRIGSGNHFFQFCSIGEDCQDKKFAGENTELEIGDNNIFRESCTVHRGTVQDNGLTKVGNGNLFMINTHVAHDCVIGDNNIFANNVTLAGHVHIGDWVIFGGLSGAHQFCSIGSHCFCGAGSIIVKDIPPYVMVGGTPMTTYGINSEGLRRRGFSSEQITGLKRAYKVVYRQGNTIEQAVEKLQEMAKEQPVVSLLSEFLANAKRGILR